MTIDLLTVCILTATQVILAITVLVVVKRTGRAHADLREAVLGLSEENGRLWRLLAKLADVPVEERR